MASIIPTINTGTKEEAILRDIPDPTNLLLSRLDSWVHAVGLFENYVEAQIAIQKNTTAGLEKARKVAADAPRFDFTSTQISSPSAETSGNGGAPLPTSASSPSSLAAPESNTLTRIVSGGSAAPPATIPGIAESFEFVRTRTDALINKSNETAEALRNSVLPQLQTIRADIEKHVKTLKTSGIKQAKDVERAKGVTLQSIETLGHHSSSYTIASGGNRHDYKYDPYVLYRQTLNSLDEQVTKENEQIDALVFTEKSLETLESHLVQVLQQATHLFDQILSGYLGLSQESYHGIAETFGSIPPESEWANFYNRNLNQLVPYDKPKRQMSNITFQNDSHPATKPIIEGILLRKEGKLLKSWSSGYYVLTPSHYLLQYTSNNYVKDPTPEFALYLPEAHVGEVSTKEGGKYKFTVQAKDATRTVGLGSKTYAFKTNTFDEIGGWHAAIKAAAAGTHPGVSTAVPVAAAAATASSVPATPVSPVAVAVSPSSTLPVYEDPTASAEAKEAAHLAATLDQTKLK